MTDEEMREYLRNLKYIGVPVTQMADDIDIMPNTVKRLLSDQTQWRMHNATRDKVKKYIEWIKNTLGLS